MSVKDRVLKDGSRVWDIRISLGRNKDGKQVIDYRTVGPFKGTLKQQENQALREEERWKTELRKEQEKQRAAFVEHTSIKLGAYLDEWLARKQPELSDKTHELYELNIRLHIKPALGGVALNKLSPVMVQRWTDELGAKGKHRALEVSRMVLRQALKDAHGLGMVGQNVVDRTRLPRNRRPNKEPVRALTTQELRGAVAAMPKHLERLTLFLAYSGLRRGEALGLQWADVDFETGLVKVRRQVVTAKRETKVKEILKTKKSRREFALPAQAVGLLRAERLSQKEARLASGGRYNNAEGWIFADERGGFLLPGRITLAFTRAIAKADLDPALHLHCLRDTFASMMIGAGVNIETVSKTLGHESVNITSARYAHLLPETTGDAANRLNAWLKQHAGA